MNSTDVCFISCWYEKAHSFNGTGTFLFSKRNLRILLVFFMFYILPLKWFEKMLPNDWRSIPKTTYSITSTLVLFFHYLWKHQDLKFCIVIFRSELEFGLWRNVFAWWNVFVWCDVFAWWNWTGWLVLKSLSVLIDTGQHTNSEGWKGSLGPLTL